MIKIINGRKYSTETAVSIGGVASSLESNLYRVTETLYRKKSGEYFLHGQGGPMTQYATPESGGNWSGVEAISPMTYIEAKAWAEEHLTAEEFETTFGVVTDDESTVALNTNLSAAANDKLRRMASTDGISIKMLLERMIEKA